MKTIKRTVLEGCALLLLAGVAGLAVNAVRADGIVVLRDYFPKIGSQTANKAAPSGPRPEKQVLSGEPGLVESPKRSLPEHGFQTVTLDEALMYYEMGDSFTVFIDARDDEHYDQCRIPNAVQFNYYRPEVYVNDVLSFTEMAETVVVYCNGGTCEDSILAAQYLTTDLNPPVDYNKLYVFEGGIQAWTKAGYPTEPENCRP